MQMQTAKIGSLHQLAPRTVQRVLNPHGCCHQNVNLSGFDFLHRPDVQINQFGKFLLRNALGDPFATDTRAEFLQLSVNFGVA